MFNKSAFITISTASVLSSVLAVVAVATKNPHLADIFLCVSAVIASYLCWEFACNTKSCADKKVEEMQQSNEAEALWRELDKLHERISEVTNKTSNRR
jgi:hypothetical protein